MTLENGWDQGCVRLIPVHRGAATELHVNASCADGSRIEVELVDPETGQALAGFSRNESTPISTDSLGHRIGWGKRRLADVPIASFQIRFHLAKGRQSPALYAFAFRQAGNH